MCTFLGTAGKINENDVDVDAINKSEIIFLEGYLWDEGDPKKAFEKAITNANKVAMSLSDQFCVDRHKPHFLELVKHKLDITFANEQEIMSLIDAKDFNEVIDFALEALRSISKKYSSIKFGNLNSLHADGSVFLKGNQKTGNVFVRSENGLGEGILITCQYDEDAQESNTFGPLPLDLFNN